MQRVFCCGSNKFDYGKNKDNQIHSKVFMRKYIPLVVTEAPKPEFMIWQNLDFVSERLGFLKTASRYIATVFLLALIVFFSVLFSVMSLKLQEHRNLVQACFDTEWKEKMTIQDMHCFCSHYGMFTADSFVNDNCKDIFMNEVIVRLA